MKLVGRLILLSLFSMSAIAQDGLPVMRSPSPDTIRPPARRPKNLCAASTSLIIYPCRPMKIGCVHHTVLDLQQIRAEGFDHIRLPIAWNYYTGPAPDYKLSDEIFAKADYMVTNAIALKLRILFLNIQTFRRVHHRSRREHGQVPSHLAASRRALCRRAPKGVAFELLQRTGGRRHNNRHQSHLRRGHPRDSPDQSASNDFCRSRPMEFARGIGQPPTAGGRRQYHRYLALLRSDDVYPSRRALGRAGFQSDRHSFPPGRRKFRYEPDPAQNAVETMGPEKRSSNTTPSPPESNPLQSPGFSLQDTKSQSLVGRIWAACPLRRIRSIHQGRPGIARPLL